MSFSPCSDLFGEATPTASSARGFFVWVAMYSDQFTRYILTLERRRKESLAKINEALKIYEYYPFHEVVLKNIELAFNEFDNHRSQILLLACKQLQKKFIESTYKMFYNILFEFTKFNHMKYFSGLPHPTTFESKIEAAKGMTLDFYKLNSHLENSSLSLNLFGNLVYSHTSTSLQNAIKTNAVYPSELFRIANRIHREFKYIYGRKKGKPESKKNCLIAALLIYGRSDYRVIALKEFGQNDIIRHEGLGNEPENLIFDNVLKSYERYKPKK